MKPGDLAMRGWSCPDEHRIAAFAEGRLTGRALERVRAHVADCRHCLEAVAFLVRIDEAAVGPDVPEALVERVRQLVAGRRGAERPRLAWGALAAASVVVVAFWVGRQLPQPTPAPVESPPPAPSASPAMTVPALQATPTPAPHSAPAAPRRMRSGATAVVALTQLAPPPEATLAREALEFRWTEAKDALYYEVRVVTAEGDLVWETRTRAAAVRPPDAASFVSGQRYFAWIRATLRDGRTIASSARAFTVQDR